MHTHKILNKVLSTVYYTLYWPKIYCTVHVRDIHVNSLRFTLFCSFAMFPKSLVGLIWQNNNGISCIFAIIGHFSIGLGSWMRKPISVNLFYQSCHNRPKHKLTVVPLIYRPISYSSVTVNAKLHLYWPRKAVPILPIHKYLHVLMDTYPNEKPSIEAATTARGPSINLDNPPTIAPAIP